MATIPMLYGAKGSNSADFDVALPINLEPVPIQSGLSKGYFRTTAGARSVSTGPGSDRGAIVWNGQHIRVMGTSLVSVANDGTTTTLATIPGIGQVRLDYGFGRLGIVANKNLYYWDGAALTQVTDTDLGPVIDMAWMDGYYVTTDGTSIIVTDLADPTSVNPLRYGSAEADPDMVTGIMKLHGELVAFGSNTIEFYSDVGGSGFPFQVNQNATITRGCVGPFAKAYFLQSIAFVGSGRNEGLGVHVVGSGTADKISTRAVDKELAAVMDPGSIAVEARVYDDDNRLYVHLPNKTLVYSAASSKQAGEPVWAILASGLGMDSAYRLRSATLFGGQWWVGDTQSAALGVIDTTISTQFGEVPGWQFQTQFLGNKGKGFIVHGIELIGMTGRAPDCPVAMLSSSRDGQTFGPERRNKLGREGNRTKRCVWNPHRRFSNYATLRFRGVSAGPAGWASLEADIEPLTS